MMDLSQPLTYEEGAIGPVRKSLNEFDADLYLAVGDSGLLSQVPVRIHQTASEMPPELVVQALLAYTSQNGYRSVIPAGTTLRSVRQEGTQYVVDLSAEFLSRRKGHIVPCGSFRCGDGVRTGRWHGCTDHRRGGHTGRGCRRLVLGASVERFLVLLIMEAGNRQQPHAGMGHAALSEAPGDLFRKRGNTEA